MAQLCQHKDELDRLNVQVLVNEVRKELPAVELAVGPSKLDLGDLNMDDGKRLARRAVELIESGTVGYTLIGATKQCT